MIRTLFALGTGSLIALLFPLVATAQLSFLVATPREGYSGDVFYLAGAGLQPNQHLYVVMACPNWSDPSAVLDHNIKIELNGPTTDSQGNFAGFRFQALYLHQYRSLSCQIYVRLGANPYGPDIPGTYFIHAPGDPVPRCIAHMCLHAVAVPPQAHSGQVETVTLRGGWPGASGTVSITLGRREQRLPVRFSIERQAVLHIRVPHAAAYPQQAVIQVSAHLGDESSDISTRFTVVR